MKYKQNLLKTFSAVFFCAAYWSCSKPYDQALPTVTFISASPHGQDSVLLTGNVTSIGASATQYVGFSHSNQPSVNLLTNQVVLNASGSTGEFTAIVSGTQDSTYYYKAFAANSFGYAASSVLKYTFAASVPDSAPCLLANGVLTDGFSNYTIVDVTNPPPPFGSYGLEADNGGSEMVNIYFKSAPANGIYTTEPDIIFPNDGNPYKAIVVITNNNGTYAANNGYNVYVAKYGGKTEVSFCNLPYVNSPSTYYLNFKLTY